jgi:hypothetical protein
LTKSCSSSVHTKKSAKPSSPSSREKQKRLTINPILEKEPKDNQITHTTNLIPNHNLRTHSKEKVTKVTWMTQVRIQSFSDQNMIGFLALGRDVVETDSRLRHSDTANNLSHEYQSETEKDCICVTPRIL